MGARSAHRNEKTPWSERRNLWTVGEVLRPWTRRPEWERAVNASKAMPESGPAVKLRARARMYGNEDVAARLLRQRRPARKEGRK